MAIKRALLLCGGTMRGAFFVGVMKSIYRLLGVDYFNTIFSTSVGVFEQSFFASKQSDVMENTWREYVHGRQLINYSNPVRGKPILDLDYLVGLFQTNKSLLNVTELKRSSVNLFTFLTDYDTKMPVMMNLKNGNIFDLMRATCALPILYPKKIIIDGKRYVDGSLANVTDLGDILNSNLCEYDEVVTVIGYRQDNRLEGFNILKPSRMPLLCSLDTNRDRIIQTIRQGEIDAVNFIKANNMSAD